MMMPTTALLICTLVAILSLVSSSNNTNGTAEHWSVVTSQRFSVAESGLRRQGLASDQDGHYFYSSFHSIIRTSSLMGSADISNVFALAQPAFRDQGNDHIGDIDVADGIIYASVEDGAGYVHPVVGLYNASDLTFLKYFNLSTEQQIDGVPWVCVDSSTRRGFTSHYDNVSQINIYDMDSFLFLNSVTMTSTLMSIQGGKIFGGFLYVTACAPDNTERFAVYKIDLTAGTVLKVADIPDDTREIEGLAFTSSVDGSVQLDVLAIKDISNPVMNYLKIRIAEVVSFKMDQVTTA
jgi:hypothetical protein